jgi:hypothetical protein
VFESKIKMGSRHHRVSSQPSSWLDDIPMPLSEQANNVAGAIDNHREQTNNVTAQNVHVERFQVSDSGISGPEIQSYRPLRE